jgi:hypothetical protein
MVSPGKLAFDPSAEVAVPSVLHLSATWRYHSCDHEIPWLPVDKWLRDVLLRFPALQHLAVHVTGGAPHHGWNIWAMAGVLREGAARFTVTMRFDRVVWGVLQADDQQPWELAPPEFKVE